MNILYVGFFSSRGAMADDYICIGKHLSQSANIYVLAGAYEEKMIIEGCKDQLQLSFNIKNKSSYFNIKNYLKIYHYIKRNSIDLVFYKTPGPVNLIVSIMCRKLPQVYYIHDYTPHSGTNRVINCITSISEKILRQYCNCAIVASDKLKKRLLEENSTWKNSRIEVIPLGMLDNLLFDGLESETDLDLLFFGRVEYYKGIDWFLHLVNERFPEKKVMIAGKGALVQECQKICKNNLNVSFLNHYVEDYELAKYISRAKVIILPYRDATGTQAIQTAFYYKKCVIATDVGSFSEIIDSGLNGIIVPPLDGEAMFNAIKEVLENESYAKELGGRAYEKALSLFTSKKIANLYMKLFEQEVRSMEETY